MPHGLPESDIFVLLAKRRRRLLLQILRETDTPLMISELANRIAERDIERPTPEDRCAVRIALYHNHLPRLADDDVVVYDEVDETVCPGVNFDTVVSVLDRAAERDRSWTDE